MEMLGKKGLVTLLLLLVVEVGIVFVRVGVVGFDQGISLKDIRENPENYLNGEWMAELYAEFVVNSVSEPVNTTDWYGNEWEICIVIIRDSYDYELQFCISSDHYQNYTLWVGESAPFKIIVGDGPYYESWSLGLVINRIAYKPHENYHAAYDAYICLVEPPKITASPLPWWTLWIIGTIAVTALVLTAIAFQRRKKGGSFTLKALSAQKRSEIPRLAQKGY